MGTLGRRSHLEIEIRSQLAAIAQRALENRPTGPCSSTHRPRVHHSPRPFVSELPPGVPVLWVPAAVVARLRKEVGHAYTSHIGFRAGVPAALVCLPAGPGYPSPRHLRLQGYVHLDRAGLETDPLDRRADGGRLRDAQAALRPLGAAGGGGRRIGRSGRAGPGGRIVPAGHSARTQSRENSRRFNTARMPRRGVEPLCPCERRILSPLRLPVSPPRPDRASK